MTNKSDPFPHHGNGEAMPSISRRALQQPFVVTCSDCKMAWRVENLSPFTMAKRQLHCIACGSIEIHVKSDYENDRWYAMAVTFGMNATKESVKIIQSMYEIWDPSEYEWFKDFVVALIAEAKGLPAPPISPPLQAVVE